MIVNSFFFRKILFLLMTCFILNSCGYELRSVTKLSNFNFDLKADETDLNLQLKDRLKEIKIVPNVNPKIQSERFLSCISYPNFIFCFLVNY